jgi:HAMP domain-containing protein
MTTDFIAALKAEIAQLEAEIRNDPRHRKLQRLRETLAEYEPRGTMHQDQPIPVNGSPADVAGAIARTKESRIKAVLIQRLKEHGPQHRKVLLEHLQRVGLMGNEKDPMAYFAAYLSNWRDIFEPDGKGVWRLREPAQD